MTKPSILLTGSSGFIGSNLLSGIGKGNVEVFSLQDGFDIANREQVFEAVKNKETVLHFASHAVGRKKMLEKSDGATKDLQALKNIIDACVKENAFLVFPSSSLVYGNSSDKVLKEDSLCDPNEAYGQAKLTAEREIEKAGKDRGLKYSILRLSTVYGNHGKGLTDHALVSIFLQNVLNNLDLKIFGPGTEKRNFIYIDDLVQVVKLILNNKEKVQNHIFNVAGSISVSVRELAETIIRITKSNSKIVSSEGIAPPDQIISIEKLKFTLGWEPVFSMKEGIKTTLTEMNLYKYNELP